MGSIYLKAKRFMKPTPKMSQKGATAVEFAIVLPLLILLIFGMIEFGLYLFNKHVITNATREGARFGVVSRPNRWENADIIQKVLDYSEQHLVTFGSERLGADDVEINPVDLDLSDGFNPETHRCVVFGCDLEVQVKFDYEFLFLRTIGIGPLKIQTLATMKME